MSLILFFVIFRQLVNSLCFFLPPIELFSLKLLLYCHLLVQKCVRQWKLDLSSQLFYLVKMKIFIFIFRPCSFLFVYFSGTTVTFKLLTCGVQRDVNHTTNLFDPFQSLKIQKPLRLVLSLVRTIFSIYQTWLVRELYYTQTWPDVFDQSKAFWSYLKH